MASPALAEGVVASMTVENGHRGVPTTPRDVMLEALRKPDQSWVPTDAVDCTLAALEAAGFYIVRAGTVVTPSGVVIEPEPGLNCTSISFHYDRTTDQEPK